MITEFHFICKKFTTPQLNGPPSLKINHGGGGGGGRVHVHIKTQPPLFFDICGPHSCGHILEVHKAPYIFLEELSRSL